MKIKNTKLYYLNDNISDVICKINIEEFEINNTCNFSICYFVGRLKQIQNGPKVSQSVPNNSYLRERLYDHAN